MKKNFALLLLLSFKAVRSVDYPIGQQLRNEYYYKNLILFKGCLEASNFKSANLILDTTDFYPTWQDLHECLRSISAWSDDERVSLTTKIQQKSHQKADHLGIFLYIIAQDEGLVAKYAKSTVGRAYIERESLGFLNIVMPRMSGFNEQKKEILLQHGWGKKYTE